MKSFRTLLVWLLLLAIPLQGFAAASSMLCAALDAPATSHVATSHVLATDEGHCASPASPAKCSSCAFCCVGAAIMPGLAPLANSKPLGSELIPYAAMHATAHIPGALERPPHSPIA